MSTWSQGSWIKENSLFSFSLIAAFSQNACAQPAVLSTLWPLPVASAQLGIVTWGDKGWSVTAWGEKVTPLSALGAFHFLLWGFCWVVGFQLCNSQLDPWICAEFSANSPSLLLFAVLPVPLLQLSQEGEDICAPFLCLFLQHLLVWIKEPLANLLPHRSGFSFLLPDPDKAAPGEAAWLWCMKKKKQTTWGLLLCFYNSFLYSLGQK